MKRIFDIMFSLFGLLLLSPVFLLISILIKIEDKGPVLYKGVRIGRYGRPFNMLKSRTMVIDDGGTGATSTPEDDSRVTRIGKILRRYKLDELAQLINVLKGEMSVVGPRPQVPWAVKLYSDEEKETILSVRPGVTDYASIKFYNEGAILRGSKDPDKDYMEKIHPEKIRLNLKYVRNASLYEDMKILSKTIGAVFKKMVV